MLWKRGAPGGDGVGRKRPSNVWAEDGGIYFGLKVKAKSPDRPLEGKHDEESVSGFDRIKTTWPTDGDELTYTSDRHVLTIGPNGSGKTRKLILSNLYRLRNWSCVVIDPKGELCAHTAAFRASTRGHRVRVIDPFGVVEANYPRLFAAHPGLFKSQGFNPLAALKPCLANGDENPRFVDDAKALAVALVKIDGGRDPYWPQAAQALVKGLLMALRLHLGEDASLGQLRKTLGYGPKKLAAFNADIIERHGGKFPALAASLGQFTAYSPEDREMNGIIRTATAQTDWLDSAPIKKDLQGEVFDFAQLKDLPTTVYLVLPPSQMVTHGGWLRLMVASILLPLLRSVEAADVPVLFMLDEFPLLGKMEIIENNYAVLRGFGVKLWTVWQDLSQAKLLYKDRWESFVSNAGIVQTFAPQDLTTRDYLSKLSGDRDNWYPKESTTEGLSKGSDYSVSQSASINWQHLKEPVMKPHELAALQEDEGVIFYRRGLMQLAVMPQPEFLPSVRELLREARRLIEE